MNVDSLLAATASVEDPPREVLERARPAFDQQVAVDHGVVGLDRARRRRRAMALTGVAAAFVAALLVVPALGRGSLGSPANAMEVVTAAGLADPLVRAQDNWRLDTAQFELVRRCMAAKGLTYYPTPIPYPTQAPTQDDLLPTDAGYGIQQHITSHGTQPTDRQQTYESTLTPAASKAYGEAFFGPPSAQVTVHLPGGATVDTSSQGCLADAQAQLYGSVTAEAVKDALPQAVSGEIRTAAEHDSTYDAQLAAWADCMRGGGFADSSPEDAISRLAGEYTRGDPATVHKEEVREAQTDLRCDGTGLRADLQQARLRAAAHVPYGQQAQLLANDKIRETAIARARVIIG